MNLVEVLMGCEIIKLRVSYHRALGLLSPEYYLSTVQVEVSSISVLQLPVRHRAGHGLRERQLPHRLHPAFLRGHGRAARRCGAMMRTMEMKSMTRVKYFDDAGFDEDDKDDNDEYDDNNVEDCTRDGINASMFWTWI